MEDQIEQEIKPIDNPPKKSDRTMAASILLSAIILSGTWIYVSGPKLTTKNSEVGISTNAGDKLRETVLPSEGVILPARLGDIGIKMLSVGVIDEGKIASLYAGRGGFKKEYENFLKTNNEENIKMSPENAGFLLNLFWALGLGNKNAILDNGPMSDPKYGGAGNFASTGGWTLATGDAMDHYSRHPFILLTPEQQILVEKVSKNIYRPCCNNSVFFPDCNHGMAMLGLLELMASQGASEDEMYRIALQVNAYWFPDMYLTMAQFLAVRDISWQNTDAKDLLGANFSSAAGYSKIKAEVATPIKNTGGSCGA
ncbi:MAG: hypothetical protein HZC14_02370 [Candidatus Niyogibacteria bacterium]|nr:hypothetical protein [Candidatus Niyogibacteria bacterium]